MGGKKAIERLERAERIARRRLADMGYHRNCIDPPTYDAMLATAMFDALQEIDAEKKEASDG